MNGIKSRSLALIAIAALAGCRADSTTVDNLQRELRWQEDRIYELEDYICEYQAMLAKKNEPPARRDDREELPIPSRSTPEVTPQIEPGIPVEPDGFDPSGPDLEPGVPGDAPRGPIELTPPSRSNRPVSPPTGDAAADRSVRRLVLNERLTGGLDLDGSPGDDGVLAVVEPLDDLGEFSGDIGEVSLMVVDPSRDEDEGRIARWDFTREQAAALWRQSSLGSGLHFELPWPHEPPVADAVRLYVRMITPDGRKLLTHADFGIALPSEGRHASREDRREPATGQENWQANAPEPPRRPGWERSSYQPPQRPEQRSIDTRPIGRPSERSGPSRPQLEQATAPSRPAWTPYR